MVPSRPCGRPSAKKRRRVQVPGQTTLTSWCVPPKEISQSTSPATNDVLGSDLVLSDVRGDVSQPKPETEPALNLEGVRGPAVVRRDSLLDWDLLWDDMVIPSIPEQCTVTQLFHALPTRMQNLYIMPLDERHAQMPGRALIVRNNTINET